MIEFLADDYDIRDGYMIHKDWVYKKLQYIQAYCNGVKPVVYVGEAMGKFIFNMKHDDKEVGWNGFKVKMDKHIPIGFVVIYSKHNNWRIKRPVLWCSVMQFGDCSDRDKETMSRILLDNLKCGVGVVDV